MDIILQIVVVGVLSCIGLLHLGDKGLIHLATVGQLFSKLLDYFVFVLVFLEESSLSRDDVCKLLLVLL